MRPADRDRVAEISRDVWDGHDYIPRVFDDWDGCRFTFQAAELEGTVVGLHRLRPYGPPDLVRGAAESASTHRARGSANDARLSDRRKRRAGFPQMRLATGEPAAAKLFEAAGLSASRRAMVAWQRVEVGSLSHAG